MSKKRGRRSAEGRRRHRQNYLDHCIAVEAANTRRAEALMMPNNYASKDHRKRTVEHQAGTR